MYIIIINLANNKSNMLIFIVFSMFLGADTLFRADFKFFKTWLWGQQILNKNIELAKRGMKQVI
jgi:hypothetical protein